MITRRLARPYGPALRFLRDLPARLEILATHSRSRKGLMRLDDHLLRDIGVTREEAQAEASRPIWDAPLHWKG